MKINELSQIETKLFGRLTQSELWEITTPSEHLPIEIPPCGPIHSYKVPNSGVTLIFEKQVLSTSDWRYGMANMP